MSEIRLHPPRCIRCAYVIQGLDSPGRCPECGTDFDLSLPNTYTRKPPLLRWVLWGPGLGLAAGVGLVCTALSAFAIGNWGAGLFLGVPLAAGCILGYRFRGKTYMLPLVLMALLGSLILSLVSMSLAGVYCGLVLSAIFAVPIAFGALLGSVLRFELKRRGFSQEGYLPVLLFALIPLVWSAFEGKNRIFSLERVSTYQVIAASPEDCWKSIVFYEEVTHEPPLILRIGLAHPLRTQGSSRYPGDIKTCIYNKGRISKRVTSAVPGELLAFDVIEQHIGYERDVRLKSGSFVLEAVEGGTRVTLTTIYEPLIAPRFCWRPAERLAIHLVHGHVLEGMKHKCENLARSAGVP